MEQDRRHLTAESHREKQRTAEKTKVQYPPGNDLNR
jgi:hypothetical protein